MCVCVWVGGRGVCEMSLYLTHEHTHLFPELFHLLPFLMTEWSRMPRADPSSIPCVG